MSRPWSGSLAYDGLITDSYSASRQRGDAGQTTVSEQTMAQPGDVVARVPPAREPLQVGNGSPGTSRDRGPWAFRPSSTTVEAGFFTWDIVSGRINGETVFFSMRGRPEEQPR